MVRPPLTQSTLWQTPPRKKDLWSHRLGPTGDRSVSSGSRYASRVMAARQW
ncbi:hypothetical protein H6F86_25735 [Phormidium sp. FACHB-592]|uniref:Uncharacterized protein n=1 Tax=Stenomitos frigidus AS-A4 TaxID=2933935 RepID=A0ABV0KSX7_9CYAN|nr:hypothetical protein [Phormidium sp. FACHB-592]MBD2077219.1 hypothetical protein [Phormidium sp. FACHB-592]